MKAEERLRWYASFFEAVKVNGTYYSLPAYDTSPAWVERAPPGFQFTVKAYSLMTWHHPKAQGREDVGYRKLVFWQLLA